MNIFYLSECPVESARFHCDKHVVKMLLELYQQMGSAMRRNGAEDKDMPLTSKGTPLKGGYHNHPCTRWVGDTRENFKWAAKHAIALCEEYTYRYGKTHACEAGIRYMARCDWVIPEGKLTAPAQAMPDEYRNANPVQAYRDYYNIFKRANMVNKKTGESTIVWNNGREEPDWWREHSCLEA
tara:strand:+ start:11951 stop:12496 length:546 start_codon:yes stop_codon:yes gene_type:complete